MHLFLLIIHIFDILFILQQHLIKTENISETIQLSEDLQYGFLIIHKQDTWLNIIFQSILLIISEIIHIFHIKYYSNQKFQREKIN